MAKRIRPHEAAEYRPEGERVPLTPKELQREYAHLRSIAMKRIKRLEGTEFKDMQIVKKYKKRLEPASKIPPKKLKFALQDAQRFLALQTSTVRGAREARNRALSTLRAHGYEGINKENIEDFGRFMQVARASSIGRWFDSERAAMTFEEGSEEGRRSR